MATVAIITAIYDELLAQGVSEAVATQIYDELLAQGLSAAELTQIYDEILAQGASAAEITQIYDEILTPFFDGQLIESGVGEVESQAVSPSLFFSSAIFAVGFAAAAAAAVAPDVFTGFAPPLSPAAVRVAAVAPTPHFTSATLDVGVAVVIQDALAPNRRVNAPSAQPTTRKYTIRIKEADYGPPGIYRIRGAKENPWIYPPVYVGGKTLGLPGASAIGLTNPSGLTTQQIPVIGMSGFYILDVSLLRDSDDSPGFYVVAFPQTGDPAAWRGAVVYESMNAADWYELTTLSDPAVAGYAAGVLPAPPLWTAFDNQSMLTVKLFSGALSSVTLAALMANVPARPNAAVIGQELVLFTTATALGNDNYTLSGFIRGRRGSEWAVGSHVGGEPFVLLNQAWIRRPVYQASSLNTLRYYTAQSIGGSLNSSIVKNIINTGNGVKPHAPCHPVASRDGSNNLTIDFNRRSRIYGSWGLTIDPPLGEQSERYEADIYEATWTTVLRTIAATTESFDYSAADQTTDGLTPGNRVKFKLYQLNYLNMRGYPLQAEL